MRIIAICFLILSSSFEVFAEQYLQDTNGDGEISYLGFGDSITYGVGDGTEPGEYIVISPRTDGFQGYIPRLSALVSIPAFNSGRPGEVFTSGGLVRLPGVLLTTPADIVGIFEGANDAIFRVQERDYRIALQTAVNMTRALGKNALLFTIPPPCCNRASLALYTRAYSSVVRELGRINDLIVVDLEKAWETTCNSINNCDLFNLPEGLHPNRKGYDVMAQTVAAALLGIDIFAPGGARDLEQALGLPEGGIIVQPELAEEQL
jgi:lysophospholipase L1-like esterase